jgi:phage baseplate assembly protein V
MSKFAGDVIGALEKLFSGQNELERRLNNLIIPGKTFELSEDGKKVKVRHGSCETPFIKWLTPCAGEVIEYRAPSVGEQCILLNLTGGNDTGACFALFGIESTDFPLPTGKPEEHMRVYPNGTVITHNHQTNELTVIMKSGKATLKAPDKVTIDTAELVCTGKINANGDIHSDADISDKTRSMDGDRSIYNDHDHNHGTPKTSPANQKQ